MYCKTVNGRRKPGNDIEQDALELTPTTRAKDSISKRERNYVCVKCHHYAGNMLAMVTHIREMFLRDPDGHPLEYIKPHISTREFLYFYLFLLL